MLPRSASFSLSRACARGALVATLLCSVVAAVQATRTGTAEAAAVTLSELAESPKVFNLGGNPQVEAGVGTSSSAAVGDVTGDGNDDIVIGGPTTVARGIQLANGQVTELDPGGYDPASHRGATQASPALGDIDGDGVLDVVIGNLGGRLAAFSVKGGTAKQIYNQFVTPAFDGAGTGLYGTPAIGYLDGDAQLDVVTSQWGQTVDGWSGPTGTNLTYLHQWVKDSIWSSPAIGDIDGDGYNEIVVGGDCFGGESQPCYGLGGGGYVWAFNLDGTLQWSYFVKDEVVWSSPALADLNGDGGLDVVVGTGVFFLRGSAANKVMAINGKSGQLMWNGATGGPVMGSPSVATVNGTPRVWVVSGGGHVHSWDAAGNPLWQQCVSDQPCSSGLGTFGGVAIADVNNDGTLDAVVQAEERLRVLDAVTGKEQTSVRSRYDRPMHASSSTPTVAQVNGKTLIVNVTIGDRSGKWSVNGGDDLVVTMWTTGTALGAAPWPTFKQNMFRTSGPLPSRAGVPPLPVPVVPSGRECFGVSGSRTDAAVVNLTPVEAEAGGFGLLTSSDVPAPFASNVNFAPGTIDPNVAIAQIGADGKVCYNNSPQGSVHLVADHLGTIKGNAYTPALTNGAPDRKVDTRIGQGGDRIPPSGRICFSVSGSPGDAAVVNLTPVEAEAGGFGLLTSSDVPAPFASNVNFAPGTIDPNVAIAQIGADGKVCYNNSPQGSVHLVADHLGTIKGNAYTPALTNGAPDRKVDTRIGQGGDRIPPSGRICFSVSGSPGDAAVVNLTPVEAEAGGFGLLTSSDVPAPFASNVNFAPGTIDPNVAIAQIGADGKVCYNNSPQGSVHLVADHLGTIKGNAYTPALTNGAPDRKVDTRIGQRG